MRLTELANDVQISKQAIGKMAKDLERKGYVAFVSDETDARAKCIHLTVKGEKLLNVAIAAVAELEANYQSLLGKKNYINLRHSVNKINEWHLRRKEK